MVGGILVAVAMTVAYVALSSWVPRALAAYAARQLEKQSGGQATVELEASPFWKLFTGRFDRLAVTLRNVDYKGQRLNRIHILWYDGHLDMGDLEVGVLHVDRIGTLEMDITLSSTAIAQMVPRSFHPFHPELAIAPGGLTLHGTASVLGLDLPIALTGQLVPSADGRTLYFEPIRFTADGNPLPLPPETKVYSLGALPLPKGIHVQFRAVHLRKGTAVFVLTGS